MAGWGGFPLFLPNDIRVAPLLHGLFGRAGLYFRIDHQTSIPCESIGHFCRFFSWQFLKVFTVQGNPTKNRVIPFNSGGDCLLGRGAINPTHVVCQLRSTCSTFVRGFHAQESKKHMGCKRYFLGGTNYVRSRKYTHCRPANIEEDQGMSLY